MKNTSHIALLLFGLLVGGIVIAGGMWYVASGDTTSVLAALVEQTPTPGAQPTFTPRGTEKKDEKKKERKPLPARGGVGSAAFGVIAGVDGDTLTVKDAQGNERAFALSAETQLIIVGKPNATTGDLVVGDKVLVLGAKEDRNTLAPRVVISAPAAYDVKNVLVGRIESATDTELQIETRAASKRVTLASDAQVFGAQLASIQASELKTKTPVLILGEPVSADEFRAQVVLPLPNGRAVQAQRKQNKVEEKTQRKENKAQEKAQRKEDMQKSKHGALLPQLGVFGTVITINGTELTVQPEPIAPRELTLDANTKIIVVGKPDATASDIQTGDKILVLGGAQNQKRGARAILVAPANYSRENVVVGKIASADATQIVLKTRAGDLKVSIGDATQIFGEGLQTLTAADLVTERAVVVIGVKNADGIMEAHVVFMPPQKK